MEAGNSQNNNYILDVNVAVYNHAPFLKQTLDSILSQKTNFRYRVLIGDDHSTDGSVEILKEYEIKYPNVSVIYQSKNLGIGKGESNGKILLKNSTAKYIAMTDGDDYWINENKIQLQIGFLEKNPDYSVTHHRAKILQENKIRKDYLNEHTPFNTTINDLANGNYIRTVSGIFRNHFLDKNFPFSIDNVSGDYHLFMIMASKGKIKYFPDEMGVYRMHQSGIWSHNASPLMRETWLENLRKLIPLFPDETKYRLKKQYLEVAGALIEQYQKNTETEKKNLLVRDTNKIKEEIPLRILKESIRKRRSLKEKIKRIFKKNND